MHAMWSLLSLSCGPRKFSTDEVCMLDLAPPDPSHSTPHHSTAPPGTVLQLQTTIFTSAMCLCMSLNHKTRSNKGCVNSWISKCSSTIGMYDLVVLRWFIPVAITVPQEQYKYVLSKHNFKFYFILNFNYIICKNEVLFRQTYLHCWCDKNFKWEIQGVTGGTDQTSGGCSLGQTIPI